MKNFYILISALAICASTSAQTINIPDQYFKTRLLQSSPSFEVAKNISGANIVVDTNGNGEIEVSEALNVYQLKIDNSAISNLTGVEYFTNLRKLVCWNNQLTTFSTAGLTNLKYLDLSSNNISTINLDALTNLESLLMVYTHCTTLDLSALTNLKEFFGYFGTLQSINVSGLTKLKHLEVQGNQISNLDVSGLTALTYLYCSSNNMVSIDLSGLANLKTFFCTANLLFNIDLSDLTSVKEIAVEGNYLSTLDLTGLMMLEGMNCSSNQLTSLILNGTSNLNILHCNYNHFTALDFSNYPNLEYVYMDYNMLQTLKLKNGIGEMMSLTGNPYLSYICVDEVNRPWVENYVHNYLGYANCVVDTSCSLGTPDFQSSNELRLFPNPSSDFVFIDGDDSVKSFDIYNLVGQRVMTNSSPSQNIPIDISELSKGIYLITIRTQTESVTRRFIKN
jgi:hypothetical protein